MPIEQSPDEVIEVWDLCAQAKWLSDGAFDPWAVDGGFDPSGLVRVGLPIRHQVFWLRQVHSIVRLMPLAICLYVVGGSIRRLGL